MNKALSQGVWINNFLLTPLILQGPDMKLNFTFHKFPVRKCCRDAAENTGIDKGKVVSRA
jgi:hypothetical protein